MKIAIDFQNNRDFYSVNGIIPILLIRNFNFPRVNGRANVYLRGIYMVVEIERKVIYAMIEAFS